jgi:PGM1 C-terminal domain
VAFEELARAFARRGWAGGPFLLDAGTIVVLPSLSFPVAELRKIVGIQHYEERLLFVLLLLRNPRLRVVYLTSQPIDPAIVDYYLGFVPDPDGARDRLELVWTGDPSPRALTAKLLERPRLVDRVRSLAGEADDAYLLPFNVTQLERTFAELVGLPLYGPHPDLVALGSKTGSRRAARAAGVPMIDGWEDLRSLAEVERAVRRLAARTPPPPEAVVVKLNDGFSGQGNAIVDVRGPARPLVEYPTTFGAAEESWPSFGAKVAAGGAIVEELIRGPGIVSPSVQLRIAPNGEVELVSTHSQLLGGPGGQVYLGCRFPADDAYRLDIQRWALRVGEVLAGAGAIGWFGIDFIVAPTPSGIETYLSEINLRIGGTTHPLWMALLAVEGSYQSATGQLVVAGRAKCYVASDNLKSPELVGSGPEQVLARVHEAGLAYDPRTRTGTTLHLLGALRAYGKVGVTCIADSPSAADDLYREVCHLLTGAVPG